MTPPLLCMQILLDKGVQESKIIFLCIIAAPEGIHKVSVWEGGRVAETPRRDGGRQ